MAADTCPRCGVNPADKWCRSRTDNTTHLCNPCGTSESMEDFMGGAITPMSEWPIKPKVDAPTAPGTEPVNCKHCKKPLSWDVPLAEWFHTDRAESGEYAIFCAGTSGPMAEA